MIDMIFTLSQLQEKCREQHQPLYVAFVDLTKAFDLVSRDGLFSVLEKVGCPPAMLRFIRSFHDGMRCCVQFDGTVSDTFPVQSGVKQGCVLAPNLFGIFFSVVLSYAFKNNEDGVFIHTRSDGNLFNLSRLKARTKVRKVLIRELLFADDAALVSHSESGLQRLVDALSSACEKFGLKISLTKTEVMGQGVADTPQISIGQHNLSNVKEFTYLGTTVTENVSIDTELSRRMGKASGAMARLNQRVWSNQKLRPATKISVYRACVLSTLLYGSETWVVYARQEKRLNTFHQRNLRRIMGIRWQDKITNSEVLRRAEITSINGLLTQRRMRWLGHVGRMEDGRIPKDVLYGELSSGSRSVGRPLLRYKDVCKRDLVGAGIDFRELERNVADRANWRKVVSDGVAAAEERRALDAAARRTRRRENQGNQEEARSVNPTPFLCGLCGRDCHSRIGLYSHMRVCQLRQNQTGSPSTS